MSETMPTKNDQQLLCLTASMEISSVDGRRGTTNQPYLEARRGDLYANDEAKSQKALQV